jgi:anti-anti-sigma factor
MIYLRIESNGKILGIHAFNKKTVTLGRAPTNMIAISDARISREHARIEVSDGVYTLIDLRSTNGTFLNGKPVRRAPLSDGDSFELGACRIAFSLTGEAAGGRTATPSTAAPSPSRPAPISLLQSEEPPDEICVQADDDDGRPEKANGNSVSPDHPGGLGPSEAEGLSRIQIQEPAARPDTMESLIAHQSQTLATIPLGTLMETIQTKKDRPARVLVMALEGAIQENTLSEFSKSIDDLCASGNTRLVIDMRHVTMVSAAGWQALVAAQQRLRSLNGEIKLAAMRRKILRAFTTLSLAIVFPQYPSVPKARSAFEK